MTQEIKEFIDKAKRSLAAAQDMLEGGYCEFAVSRGYYAMFYAAEAILLSKELHFRFRTAFDKRI